MKKFLAVQCLLLTVLLSVSFGNTQKKVPPDLTGTWILDPAKSNLGSEITDYVLTIAHNEPEIRFSKKFKRGKREISEEAVYYTDGRPQFGDGQTPNGPLPEIRWRGQKLVRRTVTRPRGSFELEFVNYEEWSLSSDKQTLTRKMTTSGPGLRAGVFIESRAVFNRRP